MLAHLLGCASIALSKANCGSRNKTDIHLIRQATSAFAVVLRPHRNHSNSWNARPIRSHGRNRFSSSRCPSRRSHHRHAARVNPDGRLHSLRSSCGSLRTARSLRSLSSSHSIHVGHANFSAARCSRRRHRHLRSFRTSLRACGRSTSRNAISSGYCTCMCINSGRHRQILGSSFVFIHSPSHSLTHSLIRGCSKDRKWHTPAPPWCTNGHVPSFLLLTAMRFRSRWTLAAIFGRDTAVKHLHCGKSVNFL